VNAGPDTAVADVDESGTLTTIIAALRRKLAASLNRLEKDIGTIAARPLDIGHVSLGAALLYLDFRFAAEAWREQRPTLADWHAEFAARPSVLANPAIDD
jgi:glutathione S-transferase